MINTDILEHGLGRVAVTDLRDHQYKVSLPKKATDIPYKFYPTGPILDQDQTSQCVIYSGEQFLRTGPISNKKLPDRYTTYKACQAIDEFPFDGDDDGTSVRALFKLYQNFGYITEYNWAFSANTIVEYVLQESPMVLGTIWTDSMFNVDKYGFIHVDGNVVGGHAYMIKGVNREYKCPDGSTGAIRICNSWGTTWGYHGLAWMSIKDLDILMKEDGEAAVAKEILKQ